MTRKDKRNKEVFIQMIGYWSKKLRVGPIVIVVDEHLENYDALVTVHKDVQYCHFDPTSLKKYNQGQFVAMIFHELGHLKCKAFYETVGKEEAEYRAEKQALKWLKKFGPQFYDNYVRDVRKKLKTKPYKGKHSYYQRAFERIKEYQNVD